MFKHYFHSVATIIFCLLSRHLIVSADPYFAYLICIQLIKLAVFQFQKYLAGWISVLGILFDDNTFYGMAY